MLCQWHIISIGPSPFAELFLNDTAIAHNDSLEVEYFNDVIQNKQTTNVYV